MYVYMMYVCKYERDDVCAFVFLYSIFNLELIGGIGILHHLNMPAIRLLYLPAGNDEETLSDACQNILLEHFAQVYAAAESIILHCELEVFENIAAELLKCPALGQLRSLNTIKT